MSAQAENPTAEPACCLCMCVCVIERESERESERAGERKRNRHQLTAWHLYFCILSLTHLVFKLKHKCSRTH